MQFVNKHVHQMSKLGVAMREHGPRGHAASTSPVLAQPPAGFQPGAASGGPTDSWTPICSSDGKHHRPGVSACPARRGARMRAAEEADGTSPVARVGTPCFCRGHRVHPVRELRPRRLCGQKQTKTTTKTAESWGRAWPHGGERPDGGPGPGLPASPPALPEWSWGSATVRVPTGFQVVGMEPLLSVCCMRSALAQELGKPGLLFLG